MCLYGAPSHFQLLCNLGVIAALQKQFHDLLLARSEPYSLLSHATPSLRTPLRCGALL